MVSPDPNSTLTPDEEIDLHEAIMGLVVKDLDMRGLRLIRSKWAHLIELRDENAVLTLRGIELLIKRIERLERLVLAMQPQSETALESGSDDTTARTCWTLIHLILYPDRVVPPPPAAILPTVTVDHTTPDKVSVSL